MLNLQIAKAKKTVDHFTFLCMVDFALLLECEACGIDVDSVKDAYNYMMRFATGEWIIGN